VVTGVGCFGKIIPAIVANSDSRAFRTSIITRSIVYGL
jgi:hypothetical protein